MKVKRVPADALRLLLHDAVHRGGRVVFDGDFAGTSMAPFILPGDRVTVQAGTLAQLAVGDVIVYANPDGKLVGHRLIRIENAADGRCFFAQGLDAANAVESVAGSDVLGRVIAVKRPSRIRVLLRRGIRFLRRQIARRLTAGSP